MQILRLINLEYINVSPIIYNRYNCQYRYYEHAFPRFHCFKDFDRDDTDSTQISQEYKDCILFIKCYFPSPRCSDYFESERCQYTYTADHVVLNNSNAKSLRIFRDRR